METWLKLKKKKYRKDLGDKQLSLVPKSTYTMVSHLEEGLVPKS
jgi:hypothetical protein